MLDKAIQAALVAGSKILEVYQSLDFDITLKGDDSPLTKADRVAHEAIVSYLHTTSFPILSEEGKSLFFEERQGWDTFWLVDPLDGTKEFIKRNDEFTVNIALIQQGEPILGVVYVPVYKQLFYALKGQGAFLINDVSSYTPAIYEKAMALPLIGINHATLHVVGSKSHMSEETLAYISAMAQRYGQPMEVVSQGSSLKLCLIAMGKADVYPRFGPTMEWDIAAGHAIILESGGEMLQSDEVTPLTYNKEQLLNPWFIAWSKGFREKYRLLK